MTGNPIAFRLPDDDQTILEQWANAAGEPTGTYVKHLLQRRIQRHREETQTGHTPKPPPHTWTHGQWTPNIAGNPSATQPPT